MWAQFFTRQPRLSEREARMSFSQWIRQIHRWLAIAFTIGIIANFAVVGQEPYPLWAGIMALLPLSLLLITGLYMFALPYVAKRTSTQE
jgi:hypothetical protein